MQVEVILSGRKGQQPLKQKVLLFKDIAKGTGFPSSSQTVDKEIKRPLTVEMV
jgi:hypothetical protein